MTAAALACTLCLSTFGAWKPDVGAARAYADSRPGTVSFAVRTQGRFFGHRSTVGYPSASTIKALMMVTYLRQPSVRRRALTRRDRALLAPMIRRSDDVAATTIRNRVGDAALVRTGRRGGMRRLQPHPIWGLSRVDASDFTRFFLNLERLTPKRHRAYAMGLLRRVVPSQQWGIGRVKPRGWTVHLKGGWGSGSGAVDHQVALLERGNQRVAIAIRTSANGSHATGKATLRGVAARLLKGLSAVEG